MVVAVADDLREASIAYLTQSALATVAFWSGRMWSRRNHRLRTRIVAADLIRDGLIFERCGGLCRCLLRGRLAGALDASVVIVMMALAESFDRLCHRGGFGRGRIGVRFERGCRIWSGGRKRLF